MYRNIDISIYEYIAHVNMAGGILRQYIVFGPKTGLINRASLSTSCPSLIKWRFEQDVEPNPNRFGKLTNLPDYSYVDGRPVPVGMNAYKRMKLQESYCKRIIQLSSEMDFAVERHKKMVEESNRQKQHMLQSKLKPKGDLLLQKEKKGAPKK